MHYTISLSSLCKLIWRHWTYKLPVRYILLSVWARLSMFSQLFIIQYMGLCVFSLPISLVMIERIYKLSYSHHRIGSVNYYPLLRVRSWNNGMRCMSLYSYSKKLATQCFKYLLWRYGYFCSTVNNWNVNCVRATAFDMRIRYTADICSYEIYLVDITWYEYYICAAVVVDVGLKMNTSVNEQPSITKKGIRQGSFLDNWYI